MNKLLIIIFFILILIIVLIIVNEKKIFGGLEESIKSMLEYGIPKKDNFMYVDYLKATESDDKDVIDLYDAYHKDVNPKISEYLVKIEVDNKTKIPQYIILNQIRIICIKTNGELSGDILESVKKIMYIMKPFMAKDTSNYKKLFDALMTMNEEISKYINSNDNVIKSSINDEKVGNNMENIISLYNIYLKAKFGIKFNYKIYDGITKNLSQNEFTYVLCKFIHNELKQLNSTEPTTVYEMNILPTYDIIDNKEQTAIEELSKTTDLKTFILNNIGRENKFILFKMIIYRCINDIENNDINKYVSNIDNILSSLLIYVPLEYEIRAEIAKINPTTDTEIYIKGLATDLSYGILTIGSRGGLQKLFDVLLSHNNFKLQLQYLVMLGYCLSNPDIYDILKKDSKYNKLYEIIIKYKGNDLYHYLYIFRIVTYTYLSSNI